MYNIWFYIMQYMKQTGIWTYAKCDTVSAKHVVVAVDVIVVVQYLHLPDVVVSIVNSVFLVHF